MSGGDTTEVPPKAGWVLTEMSDLEHAAVQLPRADCRCIPGCGSGARSCRGCRRSRRERAGKAVRRRQTTAGWELRTRSTRASSESKPGLDGASEESWSEASAEAVVGGPEKTGALKRAASWCCPYRPPDSSYRGTPAPKGSGKFPVGPLAIKAGGLVAAGAFAGVICSTLGAAWSCGRELTPDSGGNLGMKAGQGRGVCLWPLYRSPKHPPRPSLQMD